MRIIFYTIKLKLNNININILVIGKIKILINRKKRGVF